MGLQRAGVRRHSHIIAQRLIGSRSLTLPQATLPTGRPSAPPATRGRTAAHVRNGRHLCDSSAMLWGGRCWAQAVKVGDDSGMRRGAMLVSDSVAEEPVLAGGKAARRSPARTNAWPRSSQIPLPDHGETCSRWRRALMIAGDERQPHLTGAWLRPPHPGSRSESRGRRQREWRVWLDREGTKSAHDSLIARRYDILLVRAPPSSNKRHGRPACLINHSIYCQVFRS